MISKRQKNIIDFIIDYESKKGYAPSYEEICCGIGISSKSTVFKHIKSLKDRGLIDAVPGRKRSLFLTEKYLSAKINSNLLKQTGGGEPFRYSYADNINLPESDAGREQQKRRAFLSSGVSFDDIQYPLYDTRYIPLYGYIQAGYPVEAVQINETIAIPEGFTSKRPGDLFALKVKGDSMAEDMIADKDVIILKKTGEVPNGRIVTAIVEGYEATLKRYYRLKNGKVKLMPANPAFKPIVLDENRVKIIGELVGLLRKY